MMTRLHTIMTALLLGAAAAVEAQPPGMVDITAGWFLRGDANDHNQNNDAPTNWVYVSDFQMDANQVSDTQWNTIYQWALAHGYSFSTNGSTFGANNPVGAVNWYDAVKWCNARSEMEQANGGNASPCYYTDNLQTVYRSGNVALHNTNVNWIASGYRLPTEAEWEKAVRGGLTANRFPNGNMISHSQANYVSPLVLISYDAGPASTGGTSTTPVGSLATNGYGLHDMAGNVSEFCWDFY